MVRYIPFAIIEAANKNDKVGGQTAREIAARGGYSVGELNRLLPNWREMLQKPQAPVAEEAKGKSEQAPESFPAQEGAASEQEKEFKAHPELEQVYRDLHAAVNKNLDPKTLEAVKRNPTLVMVEKALRELERKGVIKIEC